jgi:hypothetical protein
MRPWTFAREARWMMMLGPIAPTIIVVVMFIVPWLRQVLGHRWRAASAPPDPPPLQPHEESTQRLENRA